MSYHLVSGGCAGRRRRGESWRIRSSGPGRPASLKRPGVNPPANPPRLVLSAVPKEGSCGGQEALLPLSIITHKTGSG
jgi:hypothetical protein